MSSSIPTDQPSISQTPTEAPDYWPGLNVEEEDYAPLSSDIDVYPLSNATLTVRVVKSFEYRTFKGLVLKGVDLNKVTVGELMERVKKGEFFCFFDLGREK